MAALEPFAVLSALIAVGTSAVGAHDGVAPALLAEESAALNFGVEVGDEVNEGVELEETEHIVSLFLLTIQIYRKKTRNPKNSPDLLNDKKKRSQNMAALGIIKKVVSKSILFPFLMPKSRTVLTEGATEQIKGGAEGIKGGVEIIESNVVELESNVAELESNVAELESNAGGVALHVGGRRSWNVARASRVARCPCC